VIVMTTLSSDYKE